MTEARPPAGRVPSGLAVERYEPDRAREWDAFVEASKNGTFLFRRAFMDYHSDRFDDASLIVSDRAGILALLPADRRGTEVRSHGGLTYGGFVTDQRMKAGLMLAVLDAVVAHYRAEGIRVLRYTAVPHVYALLPADEDLYALHARGARLASRRVLSVLAHAQPVRPGELRRRGQRARNHGLHVGRAESALPAFWDVLGATLAERHDATPVHTLAEITLLRDRFPEEIRLYAAFDGDRLAAGGLVFVTPRVVRTQYLASTAQGRAAGGVDLVIAHLFREAFADRPYLDLGPSHDPATGLLADGLLAYKEGLGGRAVVQDTYHLDLGG